MKKIPVKNGKTVDYALVDDEDYDELNRCAWRLNESGYAINFKTLETRKQAQDAGRKSRRRIRVWMHRVVMGLAKGDKRVTDHIDRNPLNNQKSNLRIITKQQNTQNTTRTPRTSEYRGVSWHKSGKWRAQACVNKQVYYLGSFTDEEEAAKAAKGWRLKHMPYATD